MCLLSTELGSRMLEFFPPQAHLVDMHCSTMLSWARSFRQYGRACHLPGLTCLGFPWLTLQKRSWVQFDACFSRQRVSPPLLPTLTCAWVARSLATEAHVGGVWRLPPGGLS